MYYNNSVNEKKQLSAQWEPFIGPIQKNLSRSLCIVRPDSGRPLSTLTTDKLWSMPLWNIESLNLVYNDNKILLYILSLYHMRFTECCLFLYRNLYESIIL